MDRPILFKTEMVRAIMEKRKTQTRRIIRMRDGSVCDDTDIPAYCEEEGEQRADYVMDFSKTFPMWQRLDCPKGVAGDRLWVRETWQGRTQDGMWWHEVKREDRSLLNWAWTNPVSPSFDAVPPKWIPSIFMPMEACRLWLDVARVRVEKLQEISASDIEREGAIKESVEIGKALDVWINLWDSINAKPRPVKTGGVVTHYESFPWEDVQEDRVYRGKPWHVYGNQWVWVIEFEVAEPDFYRS